MSASPPSDSRSSPDLRFCRFCKKSESPRDTLYHPCRCEGALKFSHKNCLKNVIRTTNNHECPDCGHKVEFTIVYGMQDMYVDLGQVAVDTAKKAIPLILFTIATFLYVFGCVFLWSISIPHFFGNGDLLDGILLFLSFITTVLAVLHVLEIELPYWISLKSFCNLTKVEPRGYGPILFKSEQFAPILDFQRLCVRIIQLLKLTGVQLTLFLAAAPICAAVTRALVVLVPNKLWSMEVPENATRVEDYVLLAGEVFLGHVALFVVLLVVGAATLSHKSIPLSNLMGRSLKLLYFFLFFPWYVGFFISMIISDYHKEPILFESGIQRFYSHAIVGYVYYWLQLKMIKYCAAKITERDLVDVSAEVDEVVFKPDIRSMGEFVVFMIILSVAPITTTMAPCGYRHEVIYAIYGDGEGGRDTVKDREALNPWIHGFLSLSIIVLTYLSPIFDYACIAVRISTAFCVERLDKPFLNVIRAIVFIHCISILFGILWSVPELAYRWVFDPSQQPSLSHGYFFFIIALLIHVLANAHLFYDRYSMDVLNFGKLFAVLVPTVFIIPAMVYFYVRIAVYREIIPEFHGWHEIAVFCYVSVFAWIALSTNSLTFEKSLIVEMKEAFINRRTRFREFMRSLKFVSLAVLALLLGSYGFENIFVPILHPGGLQSSFHHCLLWIGLFVYFYVIPCVRQSLEFAREKTRQVISVEPKNVTNRGPI